MREYMIRGQVILRVRQKIQRGAYKQYGEAGIMSNAHAKGVTERAVCTVSNIPD